jgi:hypothetical protein
VSSQWTGGAVSEGEVLFSVLFVTQQCMVVGVGLPVCKMQQGCPAEAYVDRREGQAAHLPAARTGSL